MLLFIFQPPLVQAIFNGDPDEVRALIFKKEDVNFQVSRFVFSFLEYDLILVNSVHASQGNTVTTLLDRF